MFLVWAAFFLGGEEGGEFFVEREEECDALGLGLERRAAVGGVHGAVKSMMGFDEAGRHGQRIVQVAERGLGVAQATGVKR